MSKRFGGRYSPGLGPQDDNRNPAPTPQMAQTKVTMTAERIGDCPAGQ